MISGTEPLEDLVQILPAGHVTKRSSLCVSLRLGTQDAHHRGALGCCEVLLLLVLLSRV